MTNRRPAARTSLRALGERWLIDKLTRRCLRNTTHGVPWGIGDDAAAVAHRRPLTVCSADMLVENVDFRRRWAGPKDIGTKAAAANLSDMAAMGAQPMGLLASIAVRADVQASDVLALLGALDARGRIDGAPLIGGDLSSTQGPMVVAVTALGSGTAPLWCRHAAQVGDLVCVSGPLGTARAGLALLESPKLARSTAALAARYCMRRQLHGDAHVRLALALRRGVSVRSATDVSDGLAIDVANLVPEGLRVALDVTRLPIAAATRTVAQAAGIAAVRWALGGGEDFVLAMALSPHAWPRAQHCARAVGAQLWPVGRIERCPKRARRVRLWPKDIAPTTGLAEAFEHFVAD